MKALHSGAGSGIHRVDAVAFVCGPDLNVCICGGTHPHVGACALGIPRRSLRDESKGSASVSVLTVVGHKEDEVVRRAAHRLAAALGCRVSVSAGLHVDDASTEDIRLLLNNFEEAVADVEKQARLALGCHD